MKTYTITLDESEMVIVANALARMPYGEVARFMVNLQRQIDEQQQSKQPDTP